MERVIHYSMSCDGASHVSSLVDLAIGGMRYCINSATGKGSDTVAETLLPSLADLLWANEANGKSYAGGGVASCSTQGRSRAMPTGRSTRHSWRL